MADNSYPGEWLRMLPAETARWVKDGLISQEQRDAIVALYPAEAPRRDRTVLIISILGSLLVGAGVILFFAANWPRIPAAVKVGAILLAMVGTYWGGYHLEYVRGDYPRLGHSLIFLGSLFYGAGIWLIAQIFHLESRYPNGFLLWSAGLLPLVWAASSRPVLYLSTLLLGIWTVMEQTEYASYNPLFPILLLAVVVPLSRRLQTVLSEAGALIGLFLWFAINVMQGDLAGGPGEFGGVVMGRVALLYGAGVLSMGLAHLGDQRAYLGIGSLITLLGTYVLTFSLGRGMAAVPHLFWGSPYLVVGLLVMLGVTLGGLYVYWRQAEKGRIPLAAAIVLAVVAAGIANLLPEVPRMIAFNLLLFAGNVGLLVLGIHRRSELLVNLGLVAFVVHVFTRYVDLFFDAMDKSVFFILGGILLLGGGWLLERNRRRWVGDWGGDA